jgi:hypothetical protein
MTRGKYITAARVAAIRAEIRPIEWSILNDVARLNIASGNQLQRLHYQDSESGRRVARLDLNRLTESELITRLGRQVGGRRAGSKGFCYSLGVAGQRLIRQQLNRPREAWAPSSSILAHALAVSEMYVQLREIEDGGMVTLEQFTTEPRCWRTYYGPGGSRLILKPDAYIVTGIDDYLDSWFIEVDRATESMTRIREKAKAYYRHWQSGREQSSEGVYPTVLFVVPDEKRRTQIIETLANLAAEQWQLFQVVTADTAVGAMASGELINNKREEVN